MLTVRGMAIVVLASSGFALTHAVAPGVAKSGEVLAPRATPLIFTVVGTDLKPVGDSLGAIRFERDLVIFLVGYNNACEEPAPKGRVSQTRDTLRAQVTIHEPPIDRLCPSDSRPILYEARAPRSGKVKTVVMRIGSTHERREYLILSAPVP